MSIPLGIPLMVVVKTDLFFKKSIMMLYCYDIVINVTWVKGGSNYFEVIL